MLSDADVDVAIQQVTRALRSRAVAILIRDPPVDIRCPDTSDLDFVVLADIEEMCSERLQLIAPSNNCTTMADLTWLPWNWVNDAESAATRGWVPHRVLSSKLVWDSGRDLARHCREIRTNMYRSDIQEKRTAVFLGLGLDTVREIGITWDFPALALFWLHMAHAACLAVILDGMRRLCPNVYTRPFDYLDEVERQVLPGLRSQWIGALRLDADLLQIIPALKRTHGVISQRFPEPDWPANIRAGTRFEYRYWLSQRELQWRIEVALEMARRGDAAGAVFYLRFCAYATARIPMVHVRSIEGRVVSFLRPEQAILPELERLVPEVLEDLELIFAGTLGFNADALKGSLSVFDEFRQRSVAFLRSCGTPVADLKEWIPVSASAA